MNIVITGHIDHGKSTLIGRLLYDTNSLPQSIIDEVKSSSKDGIEFAYFLDCLEEEREQNITIDTTQTIFSTTKRRYTIIDAPGHREFLRNMVSGASLAHAAVLMVDVDRRMEEQTRRHANILRLLGLRQVIVAINKMDSVNWSEEKFTSVEAEVKEFFNKLELTPIAIIPIAAKTGATIKNREAALGWYKGPTLLEMLDSLAEPPRLIERDLRFPVQDIYDIDGEKVVVGRVESGVLKNGEEITITPSGTKARITSIRIMGGTKDSADTGECIGLTLSAAGLKRGEVLCGSTAPIVQQSIDTVIFAMTDTPLLVDEEYVFECATQSVPCRFTEVRRVVNSSTLEVLPAGGKEIASTQAADVTIKFDAPIVLESFDKVPGLGRFVLLKGQNIHGAGIMHVE